MRRFKAILAACITAILAIALCGCEDLGAYEDVDAYLACFDSVIFVDSETADEIPFSVQTHFYNDESRENFLVDENGVYHGVPHDEYVYVSFPLKSTLTVDSFALYVQSDSEATVTVSISIFVTDGIPSVKESETDEEASDGGTDGSDSTEKKPILFNEPDSGTWVGDVTLHLKSGKWDSFVLESFQVGGVAQESIEITGGKCFLLQIKNNVPKDPTAQGTQQGTSSLPGLTYPRVGITMTNLLVRALGIENGNDAQGGN